MSNPERDPPPQSPFGEGLVMTMVSAAQVKYEVSWEWIKTGALGLPWWSTGYISMLLLRWGGGAWVPSLAGELRPCRPRHPPSKKKKVTKNRCLSGRLSCWAHVWLHLCSQGHSVHVPIIPALGWLKWKSGWCQWLSHFVHFSARCLFHGVCSLFGFNVTCRFFWFHTKRPIHISLLWIPLLSIFPIFSLCASEQPSKKYILILSYFFFHTKWITKYIDHSFTQWENFHSLLSFKATPVV